MANEGFGGAKSDLLPLANPTVTSQPGVPECSQSQRSPPDLWRLGGASDGFVNECLRDSDVEVWLGSLVVIERTNSTHLQIGWVSWQDQRQCLTSSIPLRHRAQIFLGSEFGAPQNRQALVAIDRYQIYHCKQQIFDNNASQVPCHISISPS